MEKLVIADGTSYKDWITEISDEFRKSQIRAAVKINDEMLRFYWKLGKIFLRIISLGWKSSTSCGRFEFN